MNHNRKLNNDTTGDEEWGQFISTDYVDTPITGPIPSTDHIPVLFKYELPSYDMFPMYDASSNCDMSKFDYTLNCLPILHSICIVSAIMVHTTLRLCWG
jgi:hypothetical protein